jgi:hypothetical protein
MGLGSLFKALKEGGGFLKDYVKRRYIPAAMQTTRTDEGLKYFKGQQKLQQESLEQLHKQLAERGKRLSREAQDIIDSISGPKSASGSIAKPGATQREMNKIAQQVNELQKEKNILDDIIARGVEGLDANGMMAFEYQRDKVGGLLKSLLAILGGGMAGLYWGARAEDASDLFYNPETDPFRTQEPKEAVEEMEEVTQTTPTFRDKMEAGQWGEPVANILMDIISPIPRYTDINNGRE